MRSAHAFADSATAVGEEAGVTEHIHSDAPTQLTDVTDRAARIAAVLSSTDERWAEASMLLRNLVVHYSCGGGKTQAVLTNMGFDSLRGVFEADLEELAAEQDRELATRETAELLALAFLTEMSSLGSAGARRLRNNTSYADLAKIMCRVDRDDEARGWSVAGAEATNAAEPVAVGDDPGSHEADCTHHDRRRDQRPLRVPRKDRAIAGVTEAFEEFQSRLKITEAERKSATRRQQILRGQLGRRLDIDAVFLTGSYVRDTKIKPLCDIDMMVVLKDRSYLGRHPHDVLDVVRAILVPHHGSERLTCSRRSVRVDFSAAAGDDEGDEVTGFEVVPAFKQGDCYWIPDRALAEWVSTNPQVHAQRATTANEAFSDQWKPLVKMLKTWNEHQGKPVEPSFLIEVMALDILGGEWTGDRPSEVRRFFTAAAERIGERWPDPAGTGPDVSDVLQADPAALADARTALRRGEVACTKALRLQRAGRVGDALSVWQTLFGPAFARSRG